VAMSPSMAPPRVSLIELRSSTYATAIRTYLLLNGGFCTFNATKRLPGVGVNSSSLFWLELDVIDFSWAAGGGKSPFASAWPARICFVPTVGSKPSLNTILSAYAGRQLVFGFQFGLRTSTICRPGVYPVILPDPLFWTMYGPVATSWSPYDELLPWSYFFAYSAGTGAVSGSWRADT